MWALLIVLGVMAAAIGAVVGSFLNVCVYRIPWEKSVVWPPSHCPKCLEAIEPRDNIPIVSWLLLRGKCRKCGLPISQRYPWVEFFVSVLFVLAYLIDVVAPNLDRYGSAPIEDLIKFFYHVILISLLVAAALIDIDLTLIPDSITFTGMFLGLTIGTVAPWVRLPPAEAIGFGRGFWMGLLGMLVGAGLTILVRMLGSLLFRREAMGLGDVTLMGMIGSFLGWQAAVLAFFFAAFLGLFHALVKIVMLIAKSLSGGRLRSSDRELAFGPYLSMAALLLLLSWRWVWAGWASAFFGSISVVFWYMLGMES